MIPFVPRPLIFHIFSIPVYVEPLAHIAGFLIFSILFYRHLRRDNIVKGIRPFLSLIILVLFCLYLFGKVWYELEHWQGLQSIYNSFNPFVTGLSSLGMLLGAFVALLIYVNLRSVKDSKHLFVSILDIVAIYVGISIFIIRVGCFLDGHVIGKPTNLPWAVYKFGVLRHPLALYLALASLLIFFVLVLLPKHYKIKLGVRITFFFTLYMLSRFLFSSLLEEGYSLTLFRIITFSLFLLSFSHLLLFSFQDISKKSN